LGVFSSPQWSSGEQTGREQSDMSANTYRLYLAENFIDINNDNVIYMEHLKFSIYKYIHCE